MNLFDVPISASSSELTSTCVDWKPNLVCCTQRWAGQSPFSSPTWLMSSSNEICSDLPYSMITKAA